MKPIGQILSIGTRRSFHIVAVVLSLTMVWSGAGAADPDEDEATKFLREISARVETLLVNKTLNTDQRKEVLEDLIASGFDLETMSRFVLAKHWKNATVAQREEFQSLFRDYIILTIGRHMDSIPRFEIEVTAARRLGENALALRSNLHFGENRSALFIDWRLRRNAGYWRIADVVVQGISFGAVIRSEFVAVIDANDGDVESLLAELRKKKMRFQAASG
jgi:phospholipid transport system substrate-binding protein